MGRRKRKVDPDFPFAPKINETSKRIALRLANSLSLETNPHDVVPQHMKETQNKRFTLEPISITPVPIAPRSTPSSRTVSVNAKREGEEDEAFNPGLLQAELALAVSSESECGANSDTDKSLTGWQDMSSPRLAVGEGGQEGNGLKSVDPYCNALRSNKNVYHPPETVQLDEKIFTFQPKVSSASARIAEGLHTDFMSRQQIYLEKKKQLQEQSSQQVPTSSFASSPPGQQEDKDDLNNNALLPSPISEDLKAGHPMDAPLKSGSMGDGAQPQEVHLRHQDLDTSGAGLQRLLTGPYAASACNIVLKHSNSKRKKRRHRAWFSDGHDGTPRHSHDVWTRNATEKEDNNLQETFTRSKTLPPSLGRPKLHRKLSTFNDGERLRMAKEMVEKAIKYRKVFMIQGGYSGIRHSLRRRGWVEKFYKVPTEVKKPPHAKNKKTSSDDDDDDDTDDDDDGADVDDVDNDQPTVDPYLEEDGLYGIMSRMLRNTSPSFYWVLKRDVIDYRYLAKDQMVNHYCKAGSFTTKVGLCMNMRNVPWYEDADPNTFFPRCYRLSHDEEKQAFVDDFRLTACMNILKFAWQKNQALLREIQTSDLFPSASSVIVPNAIPTNKLCNDRAATPACLNPSCAQSQPHSKCSCVEEGRAGEGDHGATTATTITATTVINVTSTTTTTTTCMVAEAATDKKSGSDSARGPRLSRSRSGDGRKKKKVVVPLRILQTAMTQCSSFLSEREHNDIDSLEESDMSEEQWCDFISWYYRLVHEDSVISALSVPYLQEVESMINRLKTRCPQFDLDGIHNVWIVKPGAKSRGRGITCYDRLEDMLKLVSSQIVKKDGKYVVQKYIERPLLVYNTKFDIRQWFLVTDWNPLTLYFYRDSYLRFCSQQFTLEDFDQAIHLSNNAIQKFCKNGPRSSHLPPENMWTHRQFKDYLRSRRQGHAWDEIIYPGMKRAIICSLLCTQDLVEYRKSAFELYGADFMLTEDLHPWLIEINSSPSMEASTPVTAKLCNKVLDDTIKVAVDRKLDKNCDIGAFELAFKQPLVNVPPYIGINLSVDGQGVRRPFPLPQRRPLDQAGQQGADISPPLRPLLRQNQVVDPANRRACTVIINGAVRKEPEAKPCTVVINGGVRRDPGLESKPCTMVIKSGVNAEPKGGVAVLYGNIRKENGSDPKAGSNNGLRREVNPDAKLWSRKDAKETGGEMKAGGKPLDTTPPKAEKGKENGAKGLGESSSPAQSLSRIVALTQSSLLLEAVKGRRMVSRTSVSSSYPVAASTTTVTAPAGPLALSVNNVENLDLKAAARPHKGGVSGGVVGGRAAWGRACTQCGQGMNLRLDTSNQRCRCQQDSLLVLAQHHVGCHPGALPSSHHTLLRPRSSHHQPQPAAATATSSRRIYASGPAAGIPLRGLPSPPLTKGEQTLLRAAEPPLSSRTSVATPCKVRRLVGGRGRRYGVRSLSNGLPVALSFSAETKWSLDGAGPSHKLLALLP